MVITGFATIDGTAAYKSRFKTSHQDYWRLLGRTGLTVSAYGFGCYRTHYRNQDHCLAFQKAILSGCNLIDTSSNYGDGGSEILIGQVLKDLTDQKQIQRSEVVIISKGGYVQGQNLMIAQERESLGNPFPDMVKYSSDCWHCIHPDFLEDQLNRSLERLNLQSLDVYLLHNPEYFLLSHKKNVEQIEIAKTEYYARIKKAFQWLEDKVQQGVIQSYGISSNTFPGKSTGTDFTSLEKVLGIAYSIHSNPHFTTIQFPFNLVETGAIHHLNQKNHSENLIAFARDNNLATLVNRPLNGFMNHKLIRLADFRITDQKLLEENFKAIQEKFNDLDQQFNTQIASMDELKMMNKSLFQNFKVGISLIENYHNFENIENWTQIRDYYIKQPLMGTITEFNKAASENILWKQFIHAYLSTLDQLMDLISCHYENDAGIRSKLIGECLNISMNDTSLSQKALHLTSSVGGITTVLVGMRQEQYVDDVLKLMNLSKIDEAENIYKNLNLQNIIEDKCSV